MEVEPWSPACAPVSSPSCDSVPEVLHMIGDSVTAQPVHGRDEQGPGGIIVEILSEGIVDSDVILYFYVLYSQLHFISFSE